MSSSFEKFWKKKTMQKEIIEKAEEISALFVFSINFWLAQFTLTSEKSIIEKYLRNKFTNS